MAKTSSKARQAKRERLVAKYAALRKELKEKGDYAALQALPRNSSPTRLHNRCIMTGRPRAYMRKFGISRISFRDLALEGKIPGVRKASW
ncbi:Alternate 30S ribosomal protein S14 [uncultured bacterium]|jgi:small subunit ribosomal protein S14|nr:Alternate 30S ribosomal protein S14 [uncultured bacterium]